MQRDCDTLNRWYMNGAAESQEQPGILSSLWDPRLQLDAVPVFHQVSQDSIDHPLLLQHIGASKLLGTDLDAIHRPAAPRDVLHDKFRRCKLSHQHIPYCGLRFVQEVGLFERRSVIGRLGLRGLRLD